MSLASFLLAALVGKGQAFVPLGSLRGGSAPALEPASFEGSDVPEPPRGWGAGSSAAGATGLLGAVAAGLVLGRVACRRAQRGSALTVMRANMPSGASGFSTGGISKRDPMRILRGEELRMSPAVPFLEYPEQLEGWVGGEKGFDPLGISNALPVYLLREAELKHGRVCMLATAGWIATDLGVRFSGEAFENVSTLEAHDKFVEAGYMFPFLLAIGVIELYGGWLFFSGFSMSIERDAGDFFIGKAFLPKDPAKERDMKLKELENGRLAMLAFSGIQTAAVLTQQPWPFV